MSMNNFGGPEMFISAPKIYLLVLEKKHELLMKINARKVIPEEPGG